MIPALIAAGVAVTSAIIGAKNSFDQASQQREETAEQLRRFQLLKARTESEASAMGNASGITEDSGSLTKYLAEMSAEFGRQTQWLRETGNTKANLTQTSALFGAAGNTAGAVFQFAGANNWFQQPSIK